MKLQQNMDPVSTGCCPPFHALQTHTRMFVFSRLLGQLWLFCLAGYLVPSLPIGMLLWLEGLGHTGNHPRISHQSSPTRAPPHAWLWDMERMCLRFSCSEWSQVSGLAGFKFYDVSVGMAVRRLWQMRNEIHKLMLKLKDGLLAFATW